MNAIPPGAPQVNSEQSSSDYQELLRQIRRPRFTVSGSALMFAIVGFFVVSLLWAGLAEVDQVTRGQGKVVPSQKVQVLQSLEGGIVRKILVRDGEQVTKGQVLLELDQTLRQSEFDQTRQQYFSHLATSFRLKAEMDGSESISFPNDLTVNAPSVVASETMLFTSRREELASEIRVLDDQLFQRRQELAEAKLTLDKTQQALALAHEEMAIFKPLVDKGLEPRTSYLQLQRAIIEMDGRRGAAELTVERASSAIREIQNKRGGAVEHYRANALAELSTATSKVAELSAAMSGVKDRLDRTEMRAPVTGTVSRLYVKNEGQVAQPGVPLAEVVPSDDVLRVEGYIKPEDIAGLSTGQAVRVKLTAYEFSQYGALDGTLTHIGADAVEMPNTHEMMFPIQIETTGTLFDDANKPLDVKPGMIADVDVLTGKRTILSYLTRPVLRIKSTAFRE